MKSGDRLSLRFLTDDAEGPKEVSARQYALRCLWFRREAFCVLGDKLRSAWDRPGVYVLVGQRQSDGRRQVYIGQSGSAYERLGQHLKSGRKIFWQDTAVLYSEGDGLTSGDLDYLEAELIQRASAGSTVGEYEVVNRVDPRPRTNAGESEQLWESAEVLLTAVGFDLFRRKAEARALVPETPPHDLAEAPPVPTAIVPAFEAVRNALLAAGANVDFYSTRVDYRAKVSVGQHFRVFARLNLNKADIRIELADVERVRVLAGDRPDEALIAKLQHAYRVACDRLNRKSIGAASAS